MDWKRYGQARGEGTIIKNWCDGLFYAHVPVSLLEMHNTLEQSIITLITNNRNLDNNTDNNNL